MTVTVKGVDSVSQNSIVVLNSDLLCNKRKRCKARGLWSHRHSESMSHEGRMVSEMLHCPCTLGKVGSHLQSTLGSKGRAWYSLCLISSSQQPYAYEIGVVSIFPEKGNRLNVLNAPPAAGGDN